jgi:hypothetical protein
MQVRLPGQPNPNVHKRDRCPAPVSERAAMLAASAPVLAERHAENVVQLAQSAPERETDNDWDFLSDESDRDEDEREDRDEAAERLDASMTNFVVNGLSAVR